MSHGRSAVVMLPKCTTSGALKSDPVEMMGRPNGFRSSDPSTGRAEYDRIVINRDHEIARTRLAAARLVGAGAITVLGQLAVDMPDGYFGAAATVTRFGLIYTFGLVATVVVGSILILVGSGKARRFTQSVLLVGVALFFPAVVADPVVAGGVILWNMILLGLAELGGNWGQHADDNSLSRWMTRSGPAARHLMLVALAVSTLVLGYGVGHRLSAVIVCVVLDLVAVASSGPMYVQMWRSGSKIPPVIAVLLFAMALATASLSNPIASLTILGGYLVFSLVQLIMRTPLFADLLGHFLKHPGLLVVSSFVILIAVGTVLLSLPVSAPDGHRIGPTDALFTATSASCVTGLIVLDTPHDFSRFGHAVILALIQIGGLNIMVLSTFAAVILGRDLGFRGAVALGSTLDLSSPATAYRLATFIVLSTFIVEFTGAVILGLAWFAQGASPLDAAWNGLFHSVSAFCNSGFALQTDSLVMFNQNPMVLLVFCALIVLGGLGFAVLAGLWWRIQGGSSVGLGVQIRLVLAVTTVLIVVGWALYLGLEWNRSLADLSPVNRVVNALFQSVTTRTAGFNSVLLEDLQPATLLIFMLLMFVGASPGGTGGGIKTTTAVVLLAAIPAIAARRSEVVLLGRRIPLSTVFRSTAIAVVGLVIALVAAGLLMATQDAPFDWLLFEGFSAFGTVGLSLGATATLDGLGKLVVVVAMLAGRIGPLTLALLLGQTRTARLSYPQARIMVG